MEGEWRSREDEAELESEELSASEIESSRDPSLSRLDPLIWSSDEPLEEPCEPVEPVGEVERAEPWSEESGDPVPEPEPRPEPDSPDADAEDEDEADEAAVAPLGLAAVVPGAANPKASTVGIASPPTAAGEPGIAAEGKPATVTPPPPTGTGAVEIMGAGIAEGSGIMRTTGDGVFVSRCGTALTSPHSRQNVVEAKLSSVGTWRVSTGAVGSRGS